VPIVTKSSFFLPPIKHIYNSIDAAFVFVNERRFRHNLLFYKEIINKYVWGFSMLAQAGTIVFVNKVMCGGVNHSGV
jgi:hypothetical protein